MQLHDHVPDGSDPDSHPKAICCIGPFAIYDRFSGGIINVRPHELSGRREIIFSSHQNGKRHNEKKAK